MGNNGPSGFRLDWKQFTDILKHDPCDVVHILDCCYAAEASGNAELLCASARAEEATIDLETSFTKALINELRRLSSTQVTVGTVMGEITKNRRAHSLESSPYYYLPPGKNSVILPHKSTSTMTRRPARTYGPNSARILVTVHVDDTVAQTQAGVEGLQTWLSTLLPLSVLGLGIKLEGIWSANSSMLLLSFPISVWSQLGNHPAFTFIGEVGSYNKLLQGSTQGATLALRPVSATGLENIKPGQGPAK